MGYTYNQIHRLLHSGRLYCTEDFQITMPLCGRDYYLGYKNFGTVLVYHKDGSFTVCVDPVGQIASAGLQNMLGSHTPVPVEFILSSVGRWKIKVRQEGIHMSPTFWFDKSIRLDRKGHYLLNQDPPTYPTQLSIPSFAQEVREEEGRCSHLEITS